MRTTAWFKSSLLFSDKFKKAWFYAGVVIFLGCLVWTIYLSF